MRTLALLILLILLPFSADALDVPPLKAHVNDYAHMFSARTVQEMERTLADFEAKESTQIAVLTVPTLAGENLEEYSIKVAEAWKIGWKGLDSGVILLIAEKERKIRIEVGRGLEGRLTDLISGRIIRNEITPHFKTGDYDGGLTAGLGAIMSAVKGEYGPQRAGYSPCQEECATHLRSPHFSFCGSDLPGVDVKGTRRNCRSPGIAYCRPYRFFRAVSHHARRSRCSGPHYRVDRESGVRRRLWLARRDAHTRSIYRWRLLGGIRWGWFWRIGGGSAVAGGFSGGGGGFGGGGSSGDW